jgi:hypothetical protein
MHLGKVLAQHLDDRVLADARWPGDDEDSRLPAGSEEGYNGIPSTFAID